MKRILYILMGIFMASGEAVADIRTEMVDYKAADGVVMQGYVAYQTGVKTKRPGILIVHDWMGLRGLTQEKADKLAEKGYVAFAVDIYGKGVRPADRVEASQFATKYKNDRTLLRAHIRAAYDKLAAMRQVDASKIIVIGYCFGGTTALELARSGAPLAGTVSFHGGLANPNPQDAKNIHGRVLILHGADDPFVPPQEVEEFKKEMQDAGVDMKFIAYPGAVHSFTNPEAGNDNSKGMAYNANADKKSWTEFQNFLQEVTK